MPEQQKANEMKTSDMESEEALEDKKRQQHLKHSRNEGNRSRNEIQQEKLRKALKEKWEREEPFNWSALVLYIYYSVTRISLAIH